MSRSDSSLPAEWICRWPSLSADARAKEQTPGFWSENLSPFLQRTLDLYQWAIHDPHSSEASNRPSPGLGRQLQYVLRSCNRPYLRSHLEDPSEHTCPVALQLTKMDS